MSDEKFRKPGDAASRVSDLLSGGKKPAEAEDEPLAEEIEDDEEGPRKNLFANRSHKMMLDLRFKTGNAEAFPYSFLVRAMFNPTNGILLDFSIVEVKITGRNLRPLYRAIVAQRESVVQEVDDLYAEAEADAKSTVVTKIEVKERKLVPDEAGKQLKRAGFLEPAAVLRGSLSRSVVLGRTNPRQRIPESAR